MGILERIQRIAKANINFFLDKVEDPEQMLEEKIRELEGAIDEGKASAAMYGSTFKKMKREQESLQAKSAELTEQAEAAINAGDEAQARRCLQEKVKVSERIKNIQPGVEQGEQTYNQLRESLAELSDQLTAAKAKLEELRARQRAAQAQQQFGRQVDKVTAAAEGPDFQKFEDQVMQTEAVVEIEEEIRTDTLGDEVDLEKRARELQVEAELRDMKKRLGKEDED